MDSVSDSDIKKLKDIGYETIANNSAALNKSVEYLVNDKFSAYSC